MEWIWNGWRRKDHNVIELRIKLRDKACWTAANTEDDDMFVHWFWLIHRRSTVWKGRRERCQTRLLLFQQQREDMDDVSLAYPCLHATAILVRFHVACSLVGRARSTSDLLNHEWRLCRKVELKSSTTDEVQSHEHSRNISGKIWPMCGQITGPPSLRHVRRCCALAGSPSSGARAREPA
jgi:hypothetical protein